MGIKITFSPYCIGSDREKYHLKKCRCERCLTDAGEEVTESTILSSKVHSAINKFNINESTSNVLTKNKSLEDKIKFTLFDIRELVRDLNYILEQEKTKKDE